MTANLPRRNIVRDVALIVVGAIVYAIGLNCFEIPNGLAAGGAVGLTTISRELLFRNFGVLVPVGMQVLAINVVLLVVVYFRRGLAGATRTVMGIVAQIDPNAIVAISEVYESFGQGFQSLAG